MGIFFLKATWFVFSNAVLRGIIIYRTWKIWIYFGWYMGRKIGHLKSLPPFYLHSSPALPKLWLPTRLKGERKTFDDTDLQHPIISIRRVSLTTKEMRLIRYGISWRSTHLYFGINSSLWNILRVCLMLLLDNRMSKKYFQAYWSRHSLFIAKL